MFLRFQFTLGMALLTIAAITQSWLILGISIGTLAVWMDEKLKQQ